MTTTLKHKIISGVFWRGLERFGLSGTVVRDIRRIGAIAGPGEFGV